MNDFFPIRNMFTILFETVSEYYLVSKTNRLNILLHSAVEINILQSKWLCRWLYVP